MKRSRWLPWIAAAVAILMGVLLVIAALSGSMLMLPVAAIPLVAGVGILRRRASYAYGFALYLLLQALTAPLLLEAGPASLTASIIAAAFQWVLLGLFVAAGRALLIPGSLRRPLLVWTAVAAVCTLPMLFVQAFVVPTSAMEDTLLIGDRIIARRMPRPSFANGDLVVFRYPVDRRQAFVKRIVGVPGDRIKIVNKALYRNGVVLNEPYVLHKTGYVDAYRDNFPSQPAMRLPVSGEEMLQKNVTNGEVVVPERAYFVLGDNRDSSLDSRYWGFVGFEDLIGKPLLIYDSAEASTNAMRGNERGPTRWQRLLKPL